MINMLLAFSLDKVLFTIKDFEVTILVIILALLILILLVAAIAFRQNYIIQVRLSRLMDAESVKHNQEGFVFLLNKRKKKIQKLSKEISPTIVIFSLENLGTLYVGYKNHRHLMRTITDIFTEGLENPEFVSRVDFSKIGVILTDRNRETVKEYILKCLKRLDETEFENYGYYTFDTTVAVYEAVPFENTKREVDLAVYTLKYATIKDDNIYYYNQDVLNAVLRLEEMNRIKEEELENGHIQAYIQPRVDFTTGKVVGGEILARWLNEDTTTRFEVKEFIPLFESNGFIRQLDMKMFEAACQVASDCRNKGRDDVIISVNFGRLTVNTLRSVEPLLQITSRYAVDPNKIEIEIEEGDFITRNRSFGNSILRIRQAGFRIAMDNFGKEQSSLSLLTENRFDTVKMDKFFFQNSLSNEKEKNIAKNTIKLLSSVGCKITLMGIETLTCLDYLSKIKRNVLLQGYYFSHPIPMLRFDINGSFAFTYADDSDKPAVEVKVVEKTVETNGSNGAGDSHTSINITTNTQSQELDSLRLQMESMQKKFEEQLESQHKRDMEFMNQQLEYFKKMQEMNKPVQLDAQLVDRREEQRVQRLRDELEALERERERERREREREREREERERERERERELRERDRYRDDYRDRREYDDLQQQIRDLRNQQNNNSSPTIIGGYPYPGYPVPPVYPYGYMGGTVVQQVPVQPVVQQQAQQIDVDALIDKLSKKQKEQIDSAMDDIKQQNQNLQDRLEAERKEREELEETLREMQRKAEEERIIAQIDAQTQQQIEQKANEALTLDVDVLPADDLDVLQEEEEEIKDEDEEDEDEEVVTQTSEETLEKPELSLEQIEALIKSYQDRFADDWMAHAQEELQGGFADLVKGLKFYNLKNQERRTFVDKVKKLSPEMKQIYNIIKNEFMKYNGITNRLTNSCDVIYKGRGQIGKINFTSTKIKLYLAVDPNKEDYNKIPHKDLSEKKSHHRTPFYMLVKSHLSIKRAQHIIQDMMEELGCEENTAYKPIDYATKYKFFKKDQKK